MNIKSKSIEMVDTSAIVLNPNPNDNCKYSDEKILTAFTYLDMGMSCAKVGLLTGLKRHYVNSIKLGKIRCRI